MGRAKTRKQMKLLDRIKTGTIIPENKNASFIFIIIYFLSNNIGITADTFLYYEEGKSILFIINIINLLIGAISLGLLFSRKINLQTFNFVFLYFLALNIVFTDYFYFLNREPDWQAQVFRNAYIYTITVISAGVINNFKHVIILNILYLCFIIPCAIVSESNFFTVNAPIVILLVVGFSIGIYLHIKVLKKTLLQKISLQKQLFSKEKELEIEKNKRLKEQIDFKNRELTSKSLMLGRNQEQNSTLVEDLIKLQHSTNPQPEIDKLIHKIELEAQSDLWDDFKTKFEDVHQDFYKRLHTDFPKLSKTELKLSAFLKLGLSTKEISNITQNTIESIHVARSRLRKKVDIEQGGDIEKFFHKY